MSYEGIDAFNAVDRRARQEIEALWLEVGKLKKAVNNRNESQPKSELGHWVRKNMMVKSK